MQRQGAERATACLRKIQPMPNFPQRPAKRLILLEPAQYCSHKLFHIPIDTADMQ
jgi:hypothetical protein